MIDRILYGRFYKGDIMSRMTKEEVKQRVCKAIVDAQPRLRELAESIMAEPELGFKEVKTSKKWFKLCLMNLAFLILLAMH